MSGMIDDADPAVVYSGQWTVDSASSAHYKGTVHTSSTPDDKATLTFQGKVWFFTLKKISILCCIGIGIRVDSGRTAVTQGRGRSSYAIDGGSPTVYNATGQTSSEAYRSPTLPNGRHILTMTNLDDTGHLLGLDFFQVFTPDDVVLSTSSSTTGAISTGVTSISSNIGHGAPTTSISSSGFLGTTASGPDTSSTPSPSSTTKSRDASQIPLIVGPIFGAIVICGIIFLLLKHRRRKLLEADSRNPLAWEDSRHAGKPFLKFLGMSLFAHATSSASNVPTANRFSAMHWANGRKPSSLNQDLSEPPPYDVQPSQGSHSLDFNRQPAKFRTA